MAGKRGNGEGTIYKRADGRYEARITLQDGSHKSFYAKTRQAASQRLTMALRELQQGLPIVAEKQTVERYLAHWLETRRHNLKPITLRRYEEIVRLHLSPTLGRILLARLTAQQIDQLLANKIEEGLSPTTVGHIHTILRTALGAALKVNLVARNEATLATPPRTVHREMQVLNPEQVHIMLQASRGTRLEVLYVLAVSTGMRLGELLALRWDDVDLEASQVFVQHTLHNGKKGSWELGTPKTSKSRRRINIPPTALEALRTHRARQNAERLAMGAAWQDYQLVFTRRDGEALRGCHILERDFRPMLQRAGLPAIRLHDLRHTAATLLLLQNIPVKVVSEMLGHSSVAITLDRYSHVLPTMQQDAAAAMERLLVSR